MYRKPCIALMIALIISLVSLPVSAAADVFSPNTPATEQFILKITRPAGNENTYNKVYEICGLTDKENVHVDLLRYNGEVYEPFKDVNGKSSWDDIGVVFVREVALSEGTHKIRIVAYEKANPEQKQISDFTIVVLNENARNKSIINIIKELLDKMIK